MFQYKRSDGGLNALDTSKSTIFNVIVRIDPNRLSHNMLADSCYPRGNYNIIMKSASIRDIKAPFRIRGC